MTTSPLLGAKAVRAALDRHGIRPTKMLGQNFVIDPNTIRKIVALADLKRDEDVIEIGAGVGSLTLGLAAAARSVIAIEVDERLIAVLEELLHAAPNVRIVHADALAVDLEALPASKLVANLPYNIATPVVIRVLEESPRITELTVMTQKEVGERLAAAPGSKVYGAPTVMARLFANVSIAGTVSRRAFFPVPNVDSVIVRLVRSEQPSVDAALVGRVIRAGFGQRRKTLRNALQALVGSTDRAEELLVEAGLDPQVRAEDVDPAGYARLARLLD